MIHSYRRTAGSLKSRPRPDSNARPFKYSHIMCGCSSCAHTGDSRTRPMPDDIQPRNSIQHLADRVLFPATSPGLAFTEPCCILMDHLRTGMDGASTPCRSPLLPFHPIPGANLSFSQAICFWGGFALYIRACVCICPHK